MSARYTIFSMIYSPFKGHLSFFLQLHPKDVYVGFSMLRSCPDRIHYFNATITYFNTFIPSAPSLYPLKTSQRLTTFRVRERVH